MKNALDDENEFPSWGQGPFVTPEETVEEPSPHAPGRMHSAQGNSVGQGSCYECQNT